MSDWSEGGLISEPPLTGATEWGPFLQGILGDFAKAKIQKDYLEDYRAQGGFGQVSPTGNRYIEGLPSLPSNAAGWMPLLLIGGAVLVAVWLFKD